MESVSDAMATVELKKVNREIQKEKRRIQMQRLMEKSGNVERASIFQKANLALKIEKNSSEGFVNPKEPVSPYNKSNTGAFDANDNPKKSRPPPALRKTSTMVSHNKNNQSSKVISSRFQGKQLQTDQEQQSNDYGYTSPVTSGQVNKLARPFHIG